jgi:hypothetical protein
MVAIAARLPKFDIQANANLSITRNHDDEEDPMTFESHNPATGELVGTYPEHDQAETNVSLQRAWGGMAALVAHVLARTQGLSHSTRRPAGGVRGNLWPPDHSRDGQAACCCDCRNQEIRLGRPPQG